ncbi:hypothetical protein [Williamsia maris]|uniref:Uncharacterized protein n=1 Tax=Williamsia maris TaxID=72806 RepID=A0ABT1HJE9_9NOCA|nr:hypothetical protein [Williamsia maris]MCP2178060.1 hypothetical protein [Williamsia maris]
MPTTPAHTVEALTAVEFAIKIIHPDTRTHAQRFHAGFLTARNIDTDTITAHWNTIADQWPQD